MFDCKFDIISVRSPILEGISFLHAPTQQHPKIYTDALIECNVAGNPLPQVSFRYGNMKIDNGKSIVFKGLLHYLLCCQFAQ